MASSAVLRDLWDWWALEIASLAFYLKTRLRPSSTGSAQGAGAGMNPCGAPEDRTLIFQGRFLTLHVSRGRLPFSRSIAMGRAILADKTPFSADDVHIIPGVAGDDGTCVHVIKRDVVNQWLEDVLVPCLRIDRVGLDGGDGVKWIPRRLLEDLHPAFSHIRRSRNYLAAAVVVLAITCAATCINVFLKLSNAEADIEYRVSGMKTEAVAIRKLLDEQQRNLAAAVSARKGKTQSVPVVVVWEELTRALPDDVWLTDMSLDGSQLTIAGFASRSAAQLIETLDASRLFTESGFISPVVRVPGQDGERFEIRLRIRQA